MCEKLIEIPEEEFTASTEQELWIQILNDEREDNENISQEV